MTAGPYPFIQDKPRECTECPFCGARAEAHFEFLEVLDTYPYGYWAQCGPHICDDCGACECSPSAFLPNTGEWPPAYPRCKPELGLTPEEDAAGWHRGEEHICKRPPEMRYWFIPTWQVLRWDWLQLVQGENYGWDF